MDLEKHVSFIPNQHSNYFEGILAANSTHKKLENTTEKLLLSIENCYQSMVRAEEKLMELIGLYCQDDTDMLLLGLHEMLINAYEHGNKGDAAKGISISFTANDYDLAISIEDEGEGFNWLEKMTKAYSLDDFSERGRGIPITKMCFDNVFYNMKGNKVSLIKKV